jgi:hypothetical protein
VYIKQEEGKTGNDVPDRNAFSCSTVNNQRGETGVWQVMGGQVSSQVGNSQFLRCFFMV